MGIYAFYKILTDKILIRIHIYKPLTGKKRIWSLCVSILSIIFNNEIDDRISLHYIHQPFFPI